MKARDCFLAWLGTFVVVFAANGLFHAGPGARFFDAELVSVTSARKLAGGSPLYPALIDANLVLAMLLCTLRGLRAGSLKRDAALIGALLGLVASATWNLANHAVIVGWPAIVSLVDVAWHLALGALGGTILGLLLARGARRAAA